MWLEMGLPMWHRHPRMGLPVVMQSQYGSVPQQVLSAPTQQQSIPTQSTMQNQVPQTGMAQAGSNQGQMVQGQSMNNATPQSNQLQGNNTQANNQATNKQVAENNTVPTPSPTSGSAASNTSEQSALQMLASLAVPTENQASSASMPQFSPADNGSPATDRAPAYIGTWTATLPNEASIQLQLNQDGQFNWTATQNGKASTFAGEFTVVDGRLILVRAGDRQELKGGWAVSGQNAFNFKLDGAQDGGLNFQRG